MRRTILAAGTAVVASVVLVGSVLAAGIVTNGGFENDSIDVGAFVQVDAGSSDITGWAVGGAVDWVGTYWPAPEGAKSVELNASPTQGSLSQSIDTVVNATYVVHFLLAGNPTIDPSCPSAVKTLDVSASPTAAATGHFAFDTTGRTTAAMGWEDESYTFVATGASTTLTFQSTTVGNCGPAIDAVTVTETLATAATCKKGGWHAMYDSAGDSFKNQGDCVSYYATDGRNMGAIAPTTPVAVPTSAVDSSSAKALRPAVKARHDPVRPVATAAHGKPARTNGHGRAGR